MLTFSVVGNWLLGPSVVRSRDSGDFATQSRLLKDSANSILGGPALPGLENPRPIFLDQAFDQVIPLKEPGSHHIESILAEAGLLPETTLVIPQVAGPGDVSEAGHGPIPAENTVEGIGLVQNEEETGVERQPEHHSFQEATYRKRKKATKTSHWRDSGQYHATHGGGGSDFGAAARKLKGLGKGKGKEILVRTTLMPLAKDRILVRFSLQNPEWESEKILDRIKGHRSEAEQRLAARSRDLLQSLEEVLDEEPSEEEDRDREKRAKFQRMKAKLATHLQQRPGGLELMAELSPAQLEALLKKLSARNPGLRALIEG